MEAKPGVSKTTLNIHPHIYENAASNTEQRTWLHGIVRLYLSTSIGLQYS